MRILIINRWDDELAAFGSVIDHSRHQVAYVTVPSHVPMIPATAVGTVVLDSLADTAAVEQAAETLLARMGGVDRIIAMSEYDLLTGAALRERWNLPGSRVADLAPFRDKAAAKTLLAAAPGLAAPRFEPIATIADVTAFARRCTGGVIVKPRDGAGSVGCYRIRPGESAARALRGVDLTGYEVEEWIEAPVWHIDGLLHDGTVLAVYPSRYIGTCLDFTQRNAPIGSVVEHGLIADAMADFAVACVTQLGLATGVFHLEAFETLAGPVFLEAAARVSGGPIPYSIRDVYGVDLVADWVRLQLGESPRTAPGRNRELSAGNLMLPSPHGQRLTERTPSLVGYLPGLYAEELPEVGTVFDEPSVYERLVGSFRFFGESAEAVEEAMRATDTLFHYTLTPALAAAS